MRFRTEMVWSWAETSVSFLGRLGGGGVSYGEVEGRTCYNTYYFSTHGTGRFGSFDFELLGTAAACAACAAALRAPISKKDAIALFIFLRWLKFVHWRLFEH